jgi:hypothetical protein
LGQQRARAEQALVARLAAIDLAGHGPHRPRAIYERGVEQGKSFDSIEREIADAVPDVKYPPRCLSAIRSTT